MSRHAPFFRSSLHTFDRLLVALTLTIAVLAFSALSAAGVAHAQSQSKRTPAPEGARVYIISPENGAEVSSPVTVRFGLSGMGVAPAGVKRAGTGHHHLIIDSPLPPPGQPVPADEKHRHFGGGQTEVTVELSPGTHTLQLLLADDMHVPHDPLVASDVVTVVVME